MKTYNVEIEIEMTYEIEAESASEAEQLALDRVSEEQPLTGDFDVQATACL